MNGKEKPGDTTTHPPRTISSRELPCRTGVQEDITFYTHSARRTVPYYMVERHAPELYQVLTEKLPERFSYKTPLTYENTYTL